MDAGQNAQAIKLYRQATMLRPDWSEGWWYLGTMLFDAGQFTSARGAFQHFVSVEHREPGPGFGMLGLSEFHLAHYQPALEALERGRALGLGTNTDFVQTVLYHDGILNTLFGEPEIALQRLTDMADGIAAAHPESSVLANTDLVNAFGLAALRIRKLPSEIPAPEAALVHAAGHAQALIAIQERAAAGAELRQLVAEYPSQPGVHYMYGVYLLKEDPPSALPELRREIEISPDSDAARIQLAFELLRTADYQQGLQYAKEAVALAPANFAARVVCGRLWLAIGNNERALEELRMAVKLSPGSPDAHFALSRALAAAGQADAAAHERAEFERLKALPDEAHRQ
jgi:tetratricopeptide (TPR) repeat protein